jgi:hypothetical protein
MTTHEAAHVAKADLRVVKSMAKKSNTQDDPSTLAFSAVEDALKDSIFGAPADEPRAAQPEPMFS